MFRTEALSSIVACALALMVGTASAQTIGDLAEAQRAKLRLELAMKNAPPADAQPKEQQAVSIAPVVPEPPKLRVHALYQRAGGYWVAEITNGSQLAMPVPGMVYGKYLLEGVDGEGLHLKRVAKCGGEKSCESKRVVRLGGEL
jgi:hypothetical protein